ncbi:metallophosphoesterase [Adhaeribacter aquaticus]|uniref:metallophosphoesterase n=1 Tax=Adhaeribacter aquaticus TaxID=299567 RepID=UPI0004786D0A|nr:metallophosphoesterase [Adhaeribacter aquaticus]
MLSRFITISIIILLVFLVEWYVFQAIRTVTQSLSLRYQRLIFWLFWGVFVITAITTFVAILTPRSSHSHYQTYLINTLFAIFAGKLVIVVFLLLDDGIRLLKFIVNYIFATAPNMPDAGKIKISRNEFLNKIALGVGAIPTVALLYGMVKGAYQYQVKKVTLQFPNLPQAFDGYKILQITDLHAGSFTSINPLKKAVAIINKQNPDLFLFTGDLVNNRANEVFPHIATLKQIKAKDGCYSILGNHDYGDYVSWESQEAKVKNLNRLKQAHQEIGWRLLLNEHILLEKEGVQIAVLGVENWSTRMNFPKYGNLAKAYAGSETIPFKLLLSHDPSHWDGEINTKFQNIDLTLSGHTHGMQFGINIPGLRWSPVQYVYKQWAGLYQKNKQFLYVNVGLGFLGYPGRVGFLPEITLIELRSKK